MIASVDNQASPTTYDHSKHGATTGSFKSVGYKLHNELTYRGVDWLLNSTLGVTMAYVGSRTNFGQHYYSRPLTNAFKAALSPIIKNPKRLSEGAEWGMLFTSIIVGGTAIIPIMMKLENPDNKKAFIHNIDSLVYGKEFVEAHPEFKEQDEHIGTESKKDFTTGMLARGLVLAPMVASTIHVPTKEFLVNHYYNHIGRVSKFIAEDMHAVPRSTIESMKRNGKNELVDGAEKFVSNWDFLHTTIGFDIGLTLIYAYAHEFAYKALASKKQQHDNHHHDVERANSLPIREMTPAPKVSLYQSPSRNHVDNQYVIAS